MGVSVIDNTPEELRDLVIEMMDHLEGKYPPTEQERALQESFTNLAAAFRVYPVKIAHAFMSKYPDLFHPIAAP